MAIFLYNTPEALQYLIALLVSISSFRHSQAETLQLNSNDMSRSERIPSLQFEKVQQDHEIAHEYRHKLLRGFSQAVRQKEYKDEDKISKIPNYNEENIKIYEIVANNHIALRTNCYWSLRGFFREKSSVLNISQ